MGDQVLSTRALNRALLARQGLLERERVPLAAMLERLAGVQAEQPQYPYVGLWSRMGAFDPVELERALEGRAAVRVWVMRGTIHLTTARDALAMYPLTRRLHGQSFASNFGSGLAGADPEQVAAAAVELMAAEPRTKSELADLLSERWPDAARDSLAVCVTHFAPCAQVPPRGLFRQPGQVRLAPLEQWAGGPLEDDPPAAGLVRRYLAAFGPATVADMRTWSRITGLREVFEQLRSELRTFRDERGKELFDVPDGLLPDPGAPAPPRFLPRLDNATLSHDDRSRILDGGGPHVRWRRGGLVAGHLLVDGFHRAGWRLTDEKGVATLAIDGLGELPEDVEAEARALLDFWAPGADRRELEIAP